MWYKRYGYKQPASSGGAGIGCFALLFIFALSLVAACFIAIFIENAWGFVSIVPICVSGFILVDRYSLKEGDRFRGKRHKYHIRAAERFFESGDLAGALESIRRAKIYGKIPRNLREYERNNVQDQKA